MKKILLVVISLLALIILGLVVYILAAWNRDYDAPYPEIAASNDSAMIARGKYLIYGPAHCAYCHVPPDQLKYVAQGKEIPLIGGWQLAIPPGTFRATNITPDVETGIGAMDDRTFARALRYSVSHNNKVMIPVMECQEMSDRDIAAILSYLRVQEPVYAYVPPNEFTFLGKAILAFGILRPDGPKTTPPVEVPIDSSANYGNYISNSVANCVGCHTDRDLKTGAMAGPLYAGGLVMEAEGDPEAAGYRFIAPNITPDQETGIMAIWDEEGFIQRFKEGRMVAGSPMPWEAYAMMNDTELKALYRYLMSIEPVVNDIPKIVFAPGEELPE